MSQKEQIFTTRVKSATRGIHSISDSLVNAKFAISLSDEKVWAEGLLMFYHVFSYLEDAKQRLKMREMDSLFVHPIIYRKAAFEEDLNHYLGDTWQSEPRPEPLQAYLGELERLERTRPKLLLAYVYHLYLGLLSGGQILASKRRIFGDVNKKEYYKDRVTDFGRADIPQIKRDFKATMNRIADRMTKEEQKDFIIESQRVFILNNRIVKCIRGQGEVIKNILWKLALFGLIIAGIVFAIKCCKV